MLLAVNIKAIKLSYDMYSNDIQMKQFTAMNHNSQSYICISFIQRHFANAACFKNKTVTGK